MPPRTWLTLPALGITGYPPEPAQEALAALEAEVERIEHLTDAEVRQLAYELGAR